MIRRIFSWMFQGIILFFFCQPLFVVALTAQQVYEDVRHSIYTLYSIDFNTKRTKARGSAVAVSTNLVVTNCHIALSGDYLLIKLGDDEKFKVAKLLYQDKKKDLCLLKVPGEAFIPVKIRPSAGVKIGDVVYTVGNPKGTEKTLSKGIISNKHLVDGGVWLQTDAAIYYGSSGGGLFDEDGYLIGITTKMGGNFGFAMPTEWVTEVISPTSPIYRKILAEDAEREKSPSSNINPEAITELSQLGVYGEDRIKLYRNNRECFLAIAGRNEQGHVLSLVLWNPTRSYDKTVIVFPAMTSVEEAISLIYEAVYDKEVKHWPIYSYRSDNMLSINDHSYPLYATRTKEKQYPFFLYRFEYSPRQMLLKNTSFKIVFKENNPRTGNTTAIYRLNGISLAVDAFQAQCQ